VPDAERHSVTTGAKPRIDARTVIAMLADGMTPEEIVVELAPPPDVFGYLEFGTFNF
jgi:hypothetical protein